MGIVPGNVIPAVERYIISDPLAINFMIFHEIYQVLSKTASPRSPQIFRVNPVPSGPIPVRQDFQVLFPALIGTKLRSPQKKFGSRSHRCQIRLAWNFRNIPVGHREQTVITSEINSEPGPIGTKPRSLQKKIRIPAPLGTDIVHLDFQAYSSGPSGSNRDHLRIQSEPGPIATKSG